MMGPRSAELPNAFGEKAVLKLMFGAMTRAAERWRSIRVSAFERRQMAALREELDHDDSGLSTLASCGEAIGYFTVTYFRTLKRPPPLGTIGVG
jgi:hypothetical protein